MELIVLLYSRQNNIRYCAEFDIRVLMKGHYIARPMTTQLTARRSNKDSLMTQINVNTVLALAVVYDYISKFFPSIDIERYEYYGYYFNY